MPSIPALRRQRQVDLCEFEASLAYRMSSRTTWPTEIVLGQPGLHTHTHTHTHTKKSFTNTTKNKKRE